MQRQYATMCPLVNMVQYLCLMIEAPQQGRKIVAERLTQMMYKSNEWGSIFTLFFTSLLTPPKNMQVAHS